jgi:predicted metalloprotease with PDZ domain
MLTFRLACLSAMLLANVSAFAQLHYAISYKDSTSGKIHVKIELESAIPAPVSFIMPRSVPGNYAVTKYDDFVRNLEAIDAGVATRPFVKSGLGAPRWSCEDSGFTVKSISYDVDLKEMDEQLHAASDKSIIRPGFAGLLNYSILGWIEGFDRRPVTFSLETYIGWPIFSTLAPTGEPAKGHLELSAKDYYTLADAQTFIGPAFQVKGYKALVPLFVADYVEGPMEDLDGYAWQEAKSLEILKDYFGSLPFPCYTILLRKALSRPNDDPGNFGMEHLQSSTFFGDTVHLRTGPIEEKDLWRRMPTYLHHMAHAFIPLRCYGSNYRPYVLEIPPVISNIWFNEGFMWYIVYDTLKLRGLMDEFYETVYKGDPQIKAMSLEQLSEVASFQYADDFRLGTAVFCRGALMASDINDYVKRQTGGRSSMKTIYRYLYEWSVRNGRPFTLEEFPGLIKDATGVDISAIYEKWQRPISGGR